MAKPTPPETGPNRVTDLIAGLDERMAGLQSDATRLLARPEKRGRRPSEPRAGLSLVVRQAQRLGIDLERRARQETLELEDRGNRLWATFEKEATRRLRPLLERLELPAAREVRRLSQRVEELERKLEAATKARRARRTKPEK